MQGLQEIHCSMKLKRGYLQCPEVKVTVLDSQHQEENPGCKSKSMNLVSSGAVPLTCNRWMDVPLLTEGANI